MYAFALPSTFGKKSGLEQEDLVGPVRKVRLQTVRPVRIAGLFPVEKRSPVRTAVFSPRGNKQQVITYSPGRGPDRKETFGYDERERLTLWTLRHGPSVMTSSYVYSEDGGKTKVCGTVTSNDGVVLSQTVSILDTDGNEVEMLNSDNTGVESRVTYAYRHDQSGHVTEILAYDNSPSPFHRAAFEYDSNGEITEASLYQSGDFLYDRTRSVYLFGKKIEEHRWLYEPDGSLRMKLVNTFDDRGKITELTQQDQSGEILAKTSRLHEYDQAWNWTQRTTQCWNPKTGEAGAAWTEYQLVDYYG